MSNTKQKKLSKEPRLLKNVLVVGDWFIDENWLVEEHNPETSVHTGKKHYRVITENIKTKMLTLTGAGGVAKILHRYNSNDTQKKENDKNNNNNQNTKLSVYGLGSWNSGDTRLIASMFWSDSILKNEGSFTLQGTAERTRTIESEQKGYPLCSEKEREIYYCCERRHDENVTKCNDSNCRCSHLYTLADLDTSFVLGEEIEIETFKKNKPNIKPITIERDTIKILMKDKNKSVPKILTEDSSRNNRYIFDTSIDSLTKLNECIESLVNKLDENKSEQIKRQKQQIIDGWNKAKGCKEGKKVAFRKPNNNLDEFELVEIMPWKPNKDTLEPLTKPHSNKELFPSQILFKDSVNHERYYFNNSICDESQLEKCLKEKKLPGEETAKIIGLWNKFQKVQYGTGRIVRVYQEGKNSKPELEYRFDWEIDHHKKIDDEKYYNKLGGLWYESYEKLTNKFLPITIPDTISKKCRIEKELEKKSKNIVFNGTMCECEKNLLMKLKEGDKKWEKIVGSLFEKSQKVTERFKAIVVVDLNDGVITTKLIEKLLEKYKNAWWYVRSRNEKLQWLSGLDESSKEIFFRKLKLLFIGDDIVKKHSLTTKWYVDNAPDNKKYVTSEAIDKLKDFGYLNKAVEYLDDSRHHHHIVAVIDNNNCLFVEQDNNCKLAKIKGTNNNEINVGFSSAVFASYVAEMIMSNNMVQEEEQKRALSKAKKWASSFEENLDSTLKASSSAK